jgi:3-hydroxyacyl-CoA dehydrogenase
MPLVEIIWRDGVSPEVLATALGLAKRLRKTPVVVANREGFLVNRIFIPYLQEAFFLLEDGAEAQAIDQAAVDFGFPMGPFVLIDMAGLDILVDAQRVLQDAFPHHGKLSAIAVRLVESGSLGQKTGAGVYRYDPGDVKPHPSPVTGRIVDEVRRSTGRPPQAVPPEEITERLVLRMVNEAFYAVQEGIVQRDSDVDVAMVLGTGFPDFRGGVMKYASDLGLDLVLNRLQELNRRCGERFAPCRLLLETKGIIS